MKQTLVQLFVGLLGFTVLVWGEVKHYAETHPEMISTWELMETKRMQPIQYYMYQVAYDPNTNKIWYLYSDGFWYDKPPQIRKRENQNQKALGTSNGPRTPSVGSGNYGQSPQTPANATRH